MESMPIVAFAKGPMTAIFWLCVTSIGKSRCPSIGEFFKSVTDCAAADRAIARWRELS
eukprot:COSAG02_NODE_63065_length_264_cov_0.630303_1_plen_57_part_10